MDQRISKRQPCWEMLRRCRLQPEPFGSELAADMRTLMMVIKSSSMNLESGQKSLPPPQGHFEPAAEHRGLHALVKYVGCAPWGCDLFRGARGSRVMVSTEH